MRAIVWTELKLLWREPVTLLVSLLLPTVLMLLLAGSFGSEPDADFGGISGIDFYVPIYAAAVIAVMGMLGVPSHLAAYRESGVVRRFLAAGVPRATMVLAQVFVMAALVAAGAAFMLGLGFVLYDLSVPQTPGAVVTGFAAGTLAFGGIGVALGSVVSTARAAQGLGLLLFFALFFIAGGGPPPSLLPDAINDFVAVTPMGPLVAAISDPWHGGWNVSALAWLTAIGLAGIGFAATRPDRP